jgi:hypothetical protein
VSARLLAKFKTEDDLLWYATVVCGCIKEGMKSPDVGPEIARLWWNLPSMPERIASWAVTCSQLQCWFHWSNLQQWATPSRYMLLAAWSGCKMNNV